MNEMTKPVTEEELQAKAVAPRVTQDRIESLIAQTGFVQPHGTTLTVCMLKTKQDFMLVGKSGAASLANFDASVGQRLARKDALDELWGHEGYLLRAVLAACQGDGLERLVQGVKDAHVAQGELTTEEMVRTVLTIFREQMVEG
jgi:hypothetical protein